MKRRVEGKGWQSRTRRSIITSSVSRGSCLAMVTALAVTGMGWRGQVAGAQDIATTQPTREDLQAEIAQLKAESDANAQQNTKLQAQLAQVQSQQAINNADTTAAIQQVLADADKHSQFLSVDSSSTGGWDDAKKGFFLGSEDGNFYLHPGIQYQTRYVVAYDSNPHRTQEGFEQRRVKFVFDGNIFSKDLTYKFQ